MGVASSRPGAQYPSTQTAEMSPVQDIYRKVRISNVSAKIDNAPTKLDETSPTVLKYRTPDFRASALVQMGPLEEGEKWKVGWIQACTEMMFHNTYGADGFTSWEFPELKSGRPMISDCDGRHYPWYGSNDETAIFKGPCKEREAYVAMHDNFHPHVTWRNPANSGQKDPNLTRVQRDQSFYVWLVAWNMADRRSYILKTIRWTMKLDIMVQPQRPLGHRAKLVSDPVPEQPQLVSRNVPIPKCALVPPNANSAQMLVWRPCEGKPLVIIPPSWTEKALDPSPSNHQPDSRL
ncbi:protein FAM78B-like [Liolophura sinensis]|uniref:protein FAM78B-like n=1 Tax=Liolophura sinensis TaxID=3198878 RepID=UPI003158FBA3